MAAIDSSDPATACVSVVMPLYNEEKTLTKIISLVLAQPSVAELIVVDDDVTAVVLLQSDSRSAASAVPIIIEDVISAEAPEPLILPVNLVSIPEPSTLALIVSGFGILMGFQRFRRRH